ncbi:MAG TPA: cytochrome c, partial [Blastocatellia bacterium]|nr:cytochrome c [Blastocatellia bacterium]
MSHSIRFRVLVSTIWLLIIVIMISTARTSFADSRAQRARDILKQRCFQCHGENGVARKNVFVLDRERLLSSKAVIPGDINSPLLKMIESGAMPMGGPELPDEEKAALRNWIAGGAVDWDKGEEAADKRVFLTEAAILALIRDDLLRAQERSLPFLRYFSLAHLYNAGVPDDEMETYRVALAKLVNSLSWHREITPPAAIDTARTIFRLDLRDYNWTAATWNIIIAAYPYGIRTEQSQ